MATKKLMSKQDLLRGKLEEVEIEVGNEESLIVYLGPLKTSTARDLLKKIVEANKVEENSDIIFTQETVKAISEGVVDDNGHPLLTIEEVQELPLEHYSPIARKLVDRLNNSISRGSEGEVEIPLVETANSDSPTN